MIQRKGVYPKPLTHPFPMTVLWNSLTTPTLLRTLMEFSCDFISEVWVFQDESQLVNDVCVH